MAEPIGSDQFALARKLTAENAGLKRQAEALKGGGGGGTSDIMEGRVSKLETHMEYVRRDLDQLVEGQKAIIDRLDGLSTRAEVQASASAAKADFDKTRTNVWAAMGVALGIILAVLAFASDRFDAGFGMADQRQAQLQRDADQDKASAELRAKSDATLSKLDELIARTKR